MRAHRAMKPKASLKSLKLNFLLMASRPATSVQPLSLARAALRALPVSFSAMIGPRSFLRRNGGFPLAAMQGLERDDFSSNHHPALALCWSMILFRKPVATFRDHALRRSLQDGARCLYSDPSGPVAARDWFSHPAMDLRNVAIIAHVDHGKTTLVDRLLQQSGAFREHQRLIERALDSNDLERERGITILAKVTSIVWKATRINIVDTPGHADFGGEVERILNMVDGALVLVDAAEGPLPQTKFVVSKALKVGLRPIVAINKVDRRDARPTVVAGEVFDLFAALDASEEQLDFPVLYGSAKEGWMAESIDGPKTSMAPLLDLILSRVAPPQVEDGPFRMLATILEANPYLGRIVTGRITSGVVKPNQP